ncbi:MAG: hypothetical protein RL095_3552 [Verrucomicrobiota bacterium]|jgi:sulfite exporter TauE/SafE
MLATGLILGLAGSLHCIGMCGPLNLALPLPQNQRRAYHLSLFLLQLGRILGYSLLGATAGSLGFLLNDLILQQSLSLGLGLLLFIFLAFTYCGKQIPSPVWLRRAWGALMRREAWFLVGLLNALLPCGLSFAALTAAASESSPLRGAAYMAIFGLATVPALLASAAMRQKLLSWPKLRHLAPSLSVALIASLLLLRGLGLGIPWISPSLSHDSGKVKISCCHKDSP